MTNISQQRQKDTVTIKEYDYSSMNNSLTGTMLQGTKFYVEAPTLSLASDNQAVYVVRKGDEWIEAEQTAYATAG